MKFKSFIYRKDKSWIHILPAIVVSVDDLSYREKNISIQFHILIWHFKWLWIEEDQNE